MTHIAIVFLLLISFGVVAIVVTTLMFALKKQNWSIALFLSAVFIGLLLTLISTVGRPANLQSRNSWVWLGLLPMVVGVALFFSGPPAAAPGLHPGGHHHCGRAFEYVSLSASSFPGACGSGVLFSLPR